VRRIDPQHRVRIARRQLALGVAAAAVDHQRRPAVVRGGLLKRALGLGHAAARDPQAQPRGREPSPETPSMRSGHDPRKVG
jgi:hypothetical protein